MEIATLSITAVTDNGGAQDTDASVYINENIATGTKVARIDGWKHLTGPVTFNFLQANDPDTGEPFTADCGGRYKIVQENGEYYLVVANGGPSMFNFEDKNGFNFHQGLAFEVFSGGNYAGELDCVVYLNNLNEAPVIGGVTTATQTVVDTATVNPFSSVTIADEDKSDVLTVVVKMDTASEGAFETTVTGGTYDATAGTYTITGNAATVQNAIRALKFNPTNKTAGSAAVSTTFTITVTDSKGLSVSDANTTVSATAGTQTNAAPVIGGVTTTTQTVVDTATIKPFSTVTITDNDGDQLTLTVKMDTASEGAFETTVTGGTYDATAGTYTITGSAATVQNAIRALTFNPTNKTAGSAAVSTTFTITVTDSKSPAVTNSSTVVEAAAATPTNQKPSAPLLDGGTVDSVNEELPADTEVGVLSATDPQDGTVTNFWISNGFGHDAFKISGNKLLLAKKLDFENDVFLTTEGTKKYLQVVVRAIDKDLNWTDQTFKIYVNDITETQPNQAPTLTGVTTTVQNVVETSTINPFSGVTINDIDGDQLTVTIQLNASANGILQNLINGGTYNQATGVYSITGGATAVTQAVQALQFNPADRAPGTSGTVTTGFTISVTDSKAAPVVNSSTTVSATAPAQTNQAPDAPMLQGNQVNENAGKNAYIGDLSASDKDGDMVTFEISNNPGNRFQIAGSQLQAKDSLDFEATDLDLKTDGQGNKYYEVDIRARDSGGLYSQASTFKVYVNNLNDSAPTDITISATSVPENLGVGLQVATLGVVDADGAVGNYTYTLKSNPEGKFEIANGNQLRLKQALDFETQESHDVTVEVSDGVHTYEKTFTINVANADEPQGNQAPTIGGVTATKQVVSDRGVIQPFSQVTFADDSSANLTVTVVMDQASKGTFENITPGIYDPQAGTYTVTGPTDWVRAAIQALQFNPADKDPGAEAQTTTFTITVSDGFLSATNSITQVEATAPAPANQKPTDISLSGQVAAELAATNTPVGILGATDPNSGETFNYTLLNPDGRFKIVGNQLLVDDGIKLDFEQAKSHQVAIQVTDKGGLSYVETFTVAVADVKVERTAGGPGHDVIKGGRYNDKIGGGLGNDKLWGGLGNDVLTGGKGKDTFVFDTKLNKKSNLDRIADFNVKDDSFWLDNKYMPKLGKGTEKRPVKLNKKFFTIGDKAKDKDDYLVYNSKKGVLYYDVDGSGAKAAIEFATLKKGLKMTYADFFVI